MCMGKYVVFVQMCKCLPTFQGTGGQVAQVLLVELLLPPPYPAYLAAEIWSRSQCEEITISPSGRSCQRSHAFVSVFFTLGRTMHPATAKSQGQGAALLAREGAVTALAQVPLELERDRV